MSSTLREIRSVFLDSIRLPRFWAVFLLIMALFIVMGPFGTFESLDLTGRAIYWSLTMVGCWLIAISFISVTIGIFRNFTRRPMLEIMIGAALASPFITMLNLAILHTFYPSRPELTFWPMFGYNLPITLAIGVGGPE